MRWTKPSSAQTPVQATPKVVRKGVKAAATVVDADADAVMSAVHAKMALNSNPTQPKAPKPNWALPTRSQPRMTRRTLLTLQRLLKATTTTASPAKSVRVTVTAVIAARVGIDPSVLTNSARARMQPPKLSRLSSLQLNA